MLRPTPSLLKSALLLIAVLVVSLPLRAQESSHRVDFENEIADWNLRDLNNNGLRELIVWTEGADGERYFIVHHQTQPGVFEFLDKVALPKTAAIRSLGAFDEKMGSQIALLTPSGLHLIALNAQGKLELSEQLFAINSLFHAASSGTPDFLHWGLDVDGDGHDDLLTPMEEGLGVCFCDGKRGFTKPVLLELPGRRTIQAATDGFLSLGRSYPRAVFQNISGSALPDLVWFDEDGLSWREQMSPRVFKKGRPDTYPLSWLSGSETTGVLEQTDIDLENLSEADGLVRMLSRMKTRKESLTTMRTNLVLLANQGKDAKSTFLRKPNLALRLEGVVGSGPHFVDVDRDGIRDMVLTTYASGMKDAFSRFLASRVPARVFIHRGVRGGDLFESTPFFKATFQMSTADFERWGVRRSPVLHEDIDGDGVVDLFLMKGSGREHLLTIRRGVVRDGVFSILDEPILEESIKGVENVSFRTIRSGQVGSHVIVQGKRFIKVLVLDVPDPIK